MLMTQHQTSSIVQFVREVVVSHQLRTRMASQVFRVHRLSESRNRARLLLYATTSSASFLPSLFLHHGEHLST